MEVVDEPAADGVTGSTVGGDATGHVIRILRALVVGSVAGETVFEKNSRGSVEIGHIPIVFRVAGLAISGESAGNVIRAERPLVVARVARGAFRRRALELERGRIGVTGLAVDRRVGAAKLEQSFEVSLGGADPRTPSDRDMACVTSESELAQMRVGVFVQGRRMGPRFSAEAPV